MPDSVSVTTRENWLSRIWKSIVGIPIGLLLFAAAVALLWWNEGRAVHRARSLAEGASVVIDVPVDPIGPANEGRLVHVTGLATTGETLTDTDFDISAAAIRLDRIAEMYQWREESSTKKRKKLGGGEETTTTYRYEKTWSRSWIDSSRFHTPAGHENPDGGARWQSMTLRAERVTCGAFVLPPDLAGMIGGSVARPTTAQDVEKMRAEGFTAADDGFFYHGRTPASPQIGDVRVRFEVTLPQTVSIVAVQRGASFEAYHAQAGSDILLLEEGSVAADRMFQAALTTNRITTWALRAGGFFAMFLGIALVLRPISILGSVIPLIGSILGAGTGAVAFFVALALSFTTMALAWLAYRPLLGGGLLVLAVGSLVLLLRKRRKTPAVVPPPIPPPIPTA
jgi:hypothetical protein